MRLPSWTPIAVAVPLTFALPAGLRAGWMPRGVAGDWEWPLLPGAIARTPADPLSMTIGLGLYAAVVAWGAWRLRESVAIGWEWLAIGLLTIASVGVQIGLHAAAPEGYGLAKWVTIDQPGASGYLTVARDQIDDPRRFLRDYPQWIAGQDALHIGTHPPGLFLTSWMARHTFEGRPAAARAVNGALPGSVAKAIRIVLGSRTITDRAAIALLGALTMLAAAGTVIPLYLLARSSLTARGAWATATLWPLIPSVILFQPTADTAFPLISTTALALAAWSSRTPGKRGLAPAAVAGLTLAAGMQFSLVFLGVGLIAALIVATESGRSTRERVARFLSIGVGFLAFTLGWWAVTQCNPFIVWWINQEHHRRFYAEYPRRYLPWVAANPVELAVGLGIPTAAWAIFGGKSARVAWLTLAVLAILTLSGRNLSEVGRLWLPFLPALVVAAGSGRERLGGEIATLLATAALIAIQTIGLEQTIQVVYPF